MFFKLLLVLVFVIFIEAQYSSRALCPYPHLENGRPKLRQRWRMVRYSCSVGFELVGNRYATCRDGEWDEPIPVCVKNGCEIPELKHGIIMLAHHEAWVHAFCLPGFALQGASVLYCNGRRWNGTSPTCVETAAKAKLSCDFEDADLCGWTQDEFHDFDWKRLNMKTPSSFLFTGPSYDHTYGPRNKGKSGYYMYIESTSREENQTARLLSPIYDATVAIDGCFSLYYHMYGKDIGGLRVYQKPDSVSLGIMLNSSDVDRKNYMLFEQWGNQNDYWYSSVSTLRNFSEAFQIVIEGIRGRGFTSDIAIDDVAILHGENCTEASKYASTPPTVLSESCLGRCQLFATEEVGRKANTCSCSFVCVREDDCCPDFMELCVYTDGSKQDDDTTPNQSTTIELPQTQKLISTNTTISTTSSTTLSTTTITPRWIREKTTNQTTPINRFIPTLKPTTKFTEISTTVSTTEITKPTTSSSSSSSSTTTTSTTTTTEPTTTSTTNIPTTIMLTSTPTYYKKDEIVDKNPVNDGKAGKYGKEAPKNNGWSAVKILIIAISVGCLCGLIYAVIALRTTRGRQYIERIRGTSRRDPEVRYLNTDVDIDE